MDRMILVRHAESTANVDGYFDSRPPGPPLSDAGEAQAVALADRLAGHDIRAILCSTTTRSIGSARPLAEAHHLVPQASEDLLEVHCGDLERKRDPESREIFTRVFAGWLAGNKDQPLPGGENAVQIEERMLRAVATVDGVLARGDPGARGARRFDPDSARRVDRRGGGGQGGLHVSNRELTATSVR